MGYLNVKVKPVVFVCCEQFKLGIQNY